MSIKKMPEFQQWKLKKGIAFTDAELDANRQGYMTYEQRWQLRLNLRWHVISRSFYLILITLIFAWLMSEGSKLNTSGSMLCAGGVLLFFEIVAIGLAAESIFSKWRKTRADLHKGHVSSVMGKVSRYTDWHSNKPFAVYQIFVSQGSAESLILTCSAAVYDSFLDDGEYFIFYVPHTQTILSAEFIRSIRHEVEKRHKSRSR